MIHHYRDYCDAGKYNSVHFSPLLSGEWFCSFCRDLVTPEMEYDCDSKDDPASEGFPPVDRRVRSVTH